MTDQERREYRQMMDNLRRLVDLASANGLGSATAVASTLAEHEARITALEAQRD